MVSRPTEARPREPEEMRDEITVVLQLRRKVYGTGFVVFVLVVLGTALAISWTDMAFTSVAIVWASSAILGTGAFVLFVYSVGKSALYEKAGRELLRER